MRTPRLPAQVPPEKHSSTQAVEEASAYVQGESLKAGASLANVAFSTPRSPGWGSDGYCAFLKRAKSRRGSYRMDR